MSCDAYLSTLQTFVNSLTASNHKNIVPPSVVVGGSTGGVQSDQGTLNLVPARLQATNTFSNLPGGPAGIYTSYSSGSSGTAPPPPGGSSPPPAGASSSPTWREEWVVRDLAAFAPTTDYLLWSKVSGDLLDDAEKAALCAEQTASGAQYLYTDMVFPYSILANATQIPATLIPTNCTVKRTSYHLWTVQNNKRDGTHPTGALLREALSNGSWVDHWILKGSYLPPGGTRQVALEAKGTWATDARDWLMQVRFPALGKESLIGPLAVLPDVIADIRYVQVRYTLVNLPFCA